MRSRRPSATGRVAAGSSEAETDNVEGVHVGPLALCSTAHATAPTGARRSLKPQESIPLSNAISCRTGLNRSPTPSSGIPDALRDAGGRVVWIVGAAPCQPLARFASAPIRAGIVLRYACCSWSAVDSLQRRKQPMTLRQTTMGGFLAWAVVAARRQRARPGRRRDVHRHGNGEDRRRRDGERTGDDYRRPEDVPERSGRPDCRIQDRRRAGLRKALVGRAAHRLRPARRGNADADPAHARAAHRQRTPPHDRDRPADRVSRRGPAGRQGERGLRLRHHRHRSRRQGQRLGHDRARRESHGQAGCVRRRGLCVRARQTHRRQPR